MIWYKWRSCSAWHGQFWKGKMSYVTAHRKRLCQKQGIDSWMHGHLHGALARHFLAWWFQRIWFNRKQVRAAETGLRFGAQSEKDMVSQQQVLHQNWFIGDWIKLSVSPCQNGGLFSPFPRFSSANKLLRTRQHLFSSPALSARCRSDQITCRFYLELVGESIPNIASHCHHCPR